jgi:hypothetical protein
MISRRSAIALGDLLRARFQKSHRFGTGHGVHYKLGGDEDALYDWLFVHEHERWLCNAAKKACGFDPDTIRRFTMQIHTGESVAAATESWTWKQREALGQELLRTISEDVISEDEREREKNKYDYKHQYQWEETKGLRASLELDGYVMKNGRLLIPESDVLDAQEAEGVLHALWKALKLGETEVASHHLKLSETHYLAKAWDDSISNSRKFLEVTLEACGLRLNVVGNAQLSKGAWPKDVRAHLVHLGVLSPKEKEALTQVYGLLSETGSHPYIADNEQARLMRHLALTFAQFVMLRTQGKLKDAGLLPK